MAQNKIAGLTTTLEIGLDSRSVERDALALGACIQSLTSEGWHLSGMREDEDGSLTAMLWRNWKVGVYPPRGPARSVALHEMEAS